jgi:molecular chaperone DnaK (HSP70)
MATEIKEIVGFDLGHGETAVAKAAVRSDAEPELLEVNGRKSQVTAIGIDPKRARPLIGEQAINARNLVRLDISFKRRPQQDPAYRQSVRQFLQEYYRLLAEGGQLSPDGTTRFLVGCPTGWSVEDRKNYETLLREAGIPDLIVVSESRAAMMHAKESQKFTLDELKSSVLVIDIGSSTTDVTVLVNLEVQPIDFGDNALGGSLIDKCILSDSLGTGSENLPTRKALEEFPMYRAKCEFRCRKAKEIYYSDEKLYEDPEAPVEVAPLQIGTNSLAFTPVVNSRIMKEIEERPLEELGKRSWAQAFRALLTQIKGKLDEKGIAPGVVLLTGGASRMRFTQRLCKEVFPDSICRPDSEPEFCVARGLARLGRLDLRATLFKDRVALLLESDLIATTIDKLLPEFIDKVATSLATGIAKEPMTAALQLWRAGTVKTLDDLEPHMTELVKSWLKDDGRGSQLVREGSLDWIGHIEESLAGPIGQLCQEFGIPAGALALDISPEFQTDGATGLSTMDDPTDLSSITANIATIVVGSIFVTIHHILFVHMAIVGGPFGWLIGLAIMFIGREQARDAIKQLEIPVLMRSFLLSDAKIEAKCDELIPQLAPKLAETVRGNEKLVQDLCEKVKLGISKALRSKADEAVLLLK